MVRITNDDNACFWHSLAVLMNKEHAEYGNIKRGGCIRTELAKELCDKCGMDWNEPVSVASFEEIEQILKCNLFLINAASIPVLKTTVKLLHSLM